MAGDHSIFDLGNFELQSGTVLPGTQLAYKTYGELNASKDNVVVLPTFYTGNHMRNEGFFGTGRAIDPARHFIVSVNMFGNGISSSPSNTPAPYQRSRFPGYNPVRQYPRAVSIAHRGTRCQPDCPGHRLVDGRLPVVSMGRAVPGLRQGDTAVLRLGENFRTQYRFSRRG